MAALGLGGVTRARTIRTTTRQRSGNGQPDLVNARSAHPPRTASGWPTSRMSGPWRASVMPPSSWMPSVARCRSVASGGRRCGPILPSTRLEMAIWPAARACRASSTTATEGAIPGPPLYRAPGRGGGVNSVGSKGDRYDCETRSPSRSTAVQGRLIRRQRSWRTVERSSSPRPAGSTGGTTGGSIQRVWTSRPLSFEAAYVRLREVTSAA